MSKTAARNTALTAIERMNSSPVLVSSRHVDYIVNDFMQMSHCEDDDYLLRAESAMREQLCSAYAVGPASTEKPFAFSGGTAIIPVHGTLINRYGGYYFGFITGYNFIRRQRMQAELDDDVERIIYDVNSYGGQSSGCFELADEIFSLRGGKPTIAVVDSNCFSAAYALASATDSIVVTPSGGAGSVGVLSVHFDNSKLMEEMGIKVNIIKAGAHKADGNPYEELSDDVRQEIQADVDQCYDMFVALVARNRGLDEKAVRDTEARCFSAQDALALGLIDAVATPGQAVTDFIYGPSGSDDEPLEDDTMSAANKTTTKPEAQNTQTQKQANPAANAPEGQDLNAARADGAVAERERIAGIMNCDAAKDRPNMAQHLAFNTSMSVDDAMAMLNVAGVETQAASLADPADQKKADKPETNAHFMNAMDNSTHPNVGSNGDENQAEKDPDSLEQNLTSIGYQFN